MSSRNVVRKNTELNADNVEWFENAYPKGSLSPILSMLFDKFCESHQATPREYAEIAAKELAEDLKNAAS
jgi:hypothetical protein